MGLFVLLQSQCLVVASGVCSNEKLIKRFQITSTYCCSMHATFLAFRNCLQSQCIWKPLEKKRARKIGKKDPFWRTIFLSQDLLNLTAIYYHFSLYCPRQMVWFLKLFFRPQIFLHLVDIGSLWVPPWLAALALHHMVFKREHDS